MSSHLVFKKGHRYIQAINGAIAMNTDFIRRTFEKYFSSGFKIERGTSPCDEAVTFQNGGSKTPEDGIVLKPLGMWIMGSYLYVLFTYCIMYNICKSIHIYL